MKMPSWPRKTKNDREASSSPGARRSGRTSSPQRRRLSHGRFCASCLRRPDWRIMWGEGRPSMSPHRGSEIAAKECEALWAANQASTTPTSPSPKAGT
jgi:hypothetical protein